PILVHEHLHMLDPHLPGFLGDTFVDLQADRMALERRLVQPRQLLLELYAKNFASTGLLVGTPHRDATSTRHVNLLVPSRILRADHRGRCGCCCCGPKAPGNCGLFTTGGASPGCPKGDGAGAW